MRSNLFNIHCNRIVLLKKRASFNGVTDDATVRLEFSPGAAGAVSCDEGYNPTALHHELVVLEIEIAGTWQT